MKLGKNKQGKFIFKKPFDKYNTDEILTIVYYEKLGDNLINGRSILKFVYESVGLTREDMERDISNGIWIIGLSRTDGNTLYIPENYIVPTVDNSSVLYQHKMIAIDLSLMPCDEDHSSLLLDIKTLVEAELGILPFVKEVGVGPIKGVSEEDDITYKTARDIRKGDKGNYYNKIQELEDRLKEKDRLIKELSCAVKKTCV